MKPISQQVLEKVPDADWKILRDPIAKARILGVELDKKKCPRLKKNGQQCNNPAGKGTDHLGEGCCHIHGGRGRPKKHGKKSKYSYPTLEEKLEKYKDDLKSTNKEIMRLKLMQDELDEMGPSFFTPLELQAIEDKDLRKKVDNMQKQLGKMQKLSKQVEVILATDKLVTSKHNREVGKKHTIHIESLVGVIGQISHTVDKVCLDCPKRLELGQAMERLQILGG